MIGKVEICGVNTSKLKTLTAEETAELLRRAKGGDTAAREKLIEGNLRLVLSVIQKFTNRNENLDDLFQVGCIGLIKAIDNFDMEQNVRLSTYGVPMIIGEIRRYLRDNSAIRVSRSMRDTAYRVLQVREELMSQKQTEPTVDEIAAVLGIADKAIVTYSKSLYNEKTESHLYELPSVNSYDLFELLPPLDLEELVIDYLQITYDYYLCKNSVAKNDTTIKIECELFPRKPGKNRAAVVQVKGGNGHVPSSNFTEYVNMGKHVFLFFSNQKYDEPVEGITNITKEEILNFTKTYFDILPPAIQRWAKMCI